MWAKVSSGIPLCSYSKSHILCDLNFYVFIVDNFRAEIIVIKKLRWVYQIMFCSDNACFYIIFLNLISRVTFKSCVKKVKT